MFSRIASLMNFKKLTNIVGLLQAAGTTVPDNGTSGYAVGCIFHHTDGSSGTALYVNEGSYSSCAFVAVEPPSSIVLDDLSDVGTVAYTAGKVLVADGDSYEEVAISSHATLSSAGALTLATVSKSYAVPLSSLRQEDDLQSFLPTTPDGDGGTLGLAAAAGSPVLGSSTNGTDATESASFDFVVPEDYVAGNDLTVRISAYLTAAANAASPLDVVAKLVKGGALDATDLCLTDAIDLKTVVAAQDNDFTIDNDAAGDVLAPGNVLNITISAQRDDTGGSAAGTAKIEAVTVLVPCYR